MKSEYIRFYNDAVSDNYMLVDNQKGFLMNAERKKVAVWGAGLLGKICFEQLQSDGFDVVYFIDKSPPESGEFNNLPVFSSDEVLKQGVTGIFDVAIIFLAFYSSKTEPYQQLRATGYTRPVVSFAKGDRTSWLLKEDSIINHSASEETTDSFASYRIMETLKLHSLSDNRKLSFSEIETAKRIAKESVVQVKDRDLIVKNGECDEAFVLPGANWSYDAPNEFVSLFRRIIEGAPDDFNCLRGLTQVFSGYNLYEVADGKGLRASDLEINEELEAAIRERLISNNKRFVDEWRIITEGVDSPFLFSPPPLLGEVGHVLNGVIINNDTCTYQERINLMLKSGLIEWIQSEIRKKGEIRVLEIGGGYGALAYWFKQAFPNATYTIIDLPESLLFSKLYLSLTRPDLNMSDSYGAVKYGVHFLSNHLAESVEEPFDLVINTLSMSEMSALQVNRYIDLMASFWLKNGGLFFEQNQDNKHMGYLFAQEIFAERFQFRKKVAGGRRLRNGYANIWGFEPFSLTEKE